MNGINSAGGMQVVPKVKYVKITEDTLSVDLADGSTIAVPLVWYPRLAYGTEQERSNFQIAGAGYGIHLPALDEDIGVEGLLLGKRSLESEASFARWLAQRSQAQSADMVEGVPA